MRPVREKLHVSGFGVRRRQEARAGPKRWPTDKVIRQRETSRFVNTSSARTSAVAHLESSKSREQQATRTGSTATPTGSGDRRSTSIDAVSGDWERWEHGERQRAPISLPLTRQGPSEESP